MIELVDVIKRLLVIILVLCLIIAGFVLALVIGWSHNATESKLGGTVDYPVDYYQDYRPKPTPVGKEF
jgi:hypothetical protein